MLEMMLVLGFVVRFASEFVLRSQIGGARGRYNYKKMTEGRGFQLGTVGALSLSVVSSVSIVICNKALMSTLGFHFGKLFRFLLTRALIFLLLVVSGSLLSLNRMLSLFTCRIFFEFFGSWFKV